MSRVVCLVAITAIISAFVSISVLIFYQREMKKPEMATLDISRVVSYVKTRVRERTESLPESERMKKTEKLYRDYMDKAQEAIVSVSQGRTVLVQEAVVTSPEEVEDITGEVLARIAD